MATPPAPNPTPPGPTPAVRTTLRLHRTERRGHRPAGRPLTRRAASPPRELPPVSALQRYLDLSG